MSASWMHTRSVLPASYHGRTPGESSSHHGRTPRASNGEPPRPHTRSGSLNGKVRSVTAAHPEELKIEPSGQRSPEIVLKAPQETPESSQKSPKNPGWKKGKGEEGKRRKRILPLRERHGCPPGGFPELARRRNPVRLTFASSPAVCVPRRTGRLQRGSYTPLPPRCQPASALEDPR